MTELSEYCERGRIHVLLKVLGTKEPTPQDFICVYGVRGQDSISCIRTVPFGGGCYVYQDLVEKLEQKRRNSPGQQALFPHEPEHAQSQPKCTDLPRIPSGLEAAAQMRVLGIRNTGQGP